MRHIIRPFCIRWLPFLIPLALLGSCAFQPLQPTHSVQPTPQSDWANSTKEHLARPLDSSLSLNKANREQMLGQLATIGNDGNVYISLIDIDGKKLETRQITDDATTAMEGQGRSYHRLAWSVAGQLAFAAMDRSTQKVEGQLYTLSTSVGYENNALALGTPEVVWRGDGGYVIYLYWSPNRCTTDPVCNELAFLDATPETMSLRLVRFQKGAAVRPRVQLVQTGRPLHFGWSRNGDRLLWHVNGSSLRNPDAALGGLTLSDQTTRNFENQLGSFLAPAWSPTADRWLAVTLGRVRDQEQEKDQDGEAGTGVNRGELRLFEDRGSIKIADVPLSAEYVWSPDGATVAYAQRQRVDSTHFGPIHLYSVEQEATTVLTSPFWNIRGFFWSPDGKQIGYVHDLGSPDPRWMQWRTIAVETGEDRGYSAFRAGFGMRFMLGSFSQYAQSHRYWSPNGRYLLTVDEDERLVTRIWLVDTESGSDRMGSRRAPLLIGEGSLAVWQWSK